MGCSLVKAMSKPVVVQLVGRLASKFVARPSKPIRTISLTSRSSRDQRGNGPFSFLAGTNAADEEQTIYALFGELQVPLYDNLDIQVAARYEDYGGSVGSTFDPKVAAKWQVNDGFALRGSAQTSFRGPTLNQLGGVGTSLQFVSPTGAFKAVDTVR